MTGISQMLAIRAGSLFDGERALGPGMVLTRGGLITGIDTSGAPPPADWLIHDFGDGVTVMPGLIDCHVHLSLDASPQAMANVAAGDDDALLQRMALRRPHCMRESRPFVISVFSELTPPWRHDGYQHVKAV